MKKCFYFLLLLSSTASYAQTYIPMPDSAGVWINEFKTYYLDQNNFPVYDYYEYTSYCTSGQDTTINTTDYFKIDTCGGGYMGAMRNDNGKVWFYPADSTQEYLLYDFSAQPGDTVFDVYEIYGGLGGESMLIDKVLGNGYDSIQINGVYHHVTYPGESQWIEGVGSFSGLFQWSGLNVSQFFIELYCHSEKDTTLYPIYNTQSCPWQVVGLEEEKRLEFSVYPNPISSFLQIEFSQQLNGHLYIYNYQGQLLLDQKFESSKERLDLENLNSGTYLLKIQSKEGVGVKRFVKQ